MEDLPHCPLGCGLLETRRVETRVFRHCRTCRGLWFRQNDLEGLIQRARERTRDRESSAARSVRCHRPARAGPVRCLCAEGRLMSKEDRRGVTIDVCACGGVWLDGGELEAWIRRRIDGEEERRPNNRDDDFWPLGAVLEVIVSLVDW